MLYTVVARGFVAGDVGPGLAWPLLGVLPLFVFGMWLLTASTARSALFIAWAASAMAVGSGFETFLQMNPDVIREPWYPLLNLVGLMAATVASAAFISMFATFPTGIPERRWQRISVGFFWVPVVVAPSRSSWSRTCSCPRCTPRRVKASPTRSPCPPSPGRNRWWSGSSPRGRRSSSHWRC